MRDMDRTIDEAEIGIFQGTPFTLPGQFIFLSFSTKPQVLRLFHHGLLRVILKYFKYSTIDYV